MNTKSGSIKVNLAYNMVYQILILIIPLITAPYISRILGVDGVGVYSYYFSIATYFVYFAKLGIPNYGNRCIAMHRDDEEQTDRIFCEIYSLQIISSIIIFALYILFVHFFVNQYQSIAYILSLTVLSAVFDVSWLFFGMEEFKVTTTRQMIIRVITLFSIFAFVRTADDLWKYVIIMSIGDLLSAVILWMLMYKKIGWIHLSLSRITTHLIPCIRLFIPIIALSIYRQMDKVMVGYISGVRQVGYYENAEKMITISLGLVSSFSAVIMPNMSNLLSRRKREEATVLLNKSMGYAMCLGMAIGFGIAGVSKEFIPLFFGSEFIPSINLSIWLSISAPIISWANIIRVLYLIPAEKDSIYVKSILLGAVVNLIFNSIFIPGYGALGAVFGTIIAESTVAVYQTFKVRKEVCVKEFITFAVVFGCFGFLMLMMIRLFVKFVLPIYSLGGVFGLLLEIVLGALIYMSLSYVYLKKTNSIDITRFLRKRKI